MIHNPLLYFTFSYIIMSNNFLFNIGLLATGIYIGQEYPNSVPNIKEKTIQVYKYFQTTDFYKALNDDKKKK